MNTLSYLIYNIAVFFYATFIKVASVFNLKAKLFIEGRKNIFDVISSKLNNDPSEKIWFHCSSLGEFEQARPLIENIKQNHIEYKIIVTFFSPSGYEIRKNYELADYVFYLPIDTISNAKSLINLFNPNKVFFVKYEFWYHYLNILHQKKIPIYLISATFLGSQIFFKWYGSFFRNILKKFDIIFTQNDSSKKLLNSIGIENVIVSKDTRYDRVAATVKNIKSLPKVELFKQNKKLLVCGSSYIKEETLILQLTDNILEERLKIIIAPHEINGTHLNAIKDLFQHKKICFYSTSLHEDLIKSNILVIDNIGMLSSIYQYADIALIGGGFGSKGLHNILEAAAFGMPVLFGPKNHQKYPESIQLINNGSAFVVNTSEEFNQVISSFIFDTQKHESVSHLSKKFINENTGATKVILSSIPF